LRLIVIADDLTGAAELAGIAWSCGLSTELVVAYPQSGSIAKTMEEADVVIVATDTRSMTEQEAEEETLRLLESSDLLGQSCTIFKKVDSALRGHVVAELRQLMQATGINKAVYMPANPSKGRIIKDGTYYIKNESQRYVPIAETAFANDPEFPATASVMHQRFPDADAAGIMMPDATCNADIATIINSIDNKTILAGAADLFRQKLKASLLAHLREETVTFGTKNPCVPLSESEERAGPYLILCGSTQSHIDNWKQPAAAMPLTVYEGGNDLKQWMDDAIGKYESGQGGVVLYIGYNHLTGHSTAVHLRRQMALMASYMMERCKPGHLIIEGGATAFCTLQLLNIQNLRIVGQKAPGVVTMKTDGGLLVTLKPGSYSWK
jgi:uncharacterized protein YgbK (DUF1537 family)